MSWYKTGTIAVTNGSKMITGTGTTWANPLSGVSAGRMLLLPGTGSVQMYEIESVQSDTQLTLVSVYSGTSGSGLAYAIPTTPAVSIEQFAHEFAATLAYYQQQLAGWQQILTGTGNVTLTTPDGERVTVRSQQAWDAALNGKADLTQAYRKRGDLGTADLNTIMGDQDGTWSQGRTANATAARNYPVAVAGALLVVQNTANGATGCSQLYFPYNSPRVYIRYFLAGGTWSAWSEIWNSASLANPMILDAAQTVTGQKIFSSHVIASNSVAFAGKTTTGVDISIGTVNNSNQVRVGDNNYPVVIQASTQPKIQIGSGTHVDIMDVGSPQTVTGSKAFTGGFQDNTTQIGRTTTSPPVALTSASQLNALRNGGLLFVNATTSMASLMPDSATSGYWFILCLGKNDVSANAAMLCAIQQGTPGIVFYGYLATSGVVTWDRCVSAGTAQTITGVKTFSNYPVSTGFYCKTNESTPRDIAVLRGTPNAPVQAEFFASQSNLFVRSPTGLYLLYNGLFTGTSWAKNDSAQPSFGINLGLSGANLYRSTAGQSNPVQYQHALLANGWNTVADANGFWKSASPVVKLFPNGSSELSSEAEGVTTERISEGVYRISGCLGLNSDAAWGGIDGGISNPKCRNGLERIWNDYEVEQDGSLIVRTYHRTHPDAMPFARNEIDGYSNGDPIDIPQDVFLMVRVQMPESGAVEPDTAVSDEILSEA